MSAVSIVCDGERGGVFSPARRRPSSLRHSGSRAVNSVLGRERIPSNGRRPLPFDASLLRSCAGTVGA